VALRLTAGGARSIPGPSPSVSDAVTVSPVRPPVRGPFALADGDPDPDHRDREHANSAGLTIPAQDILVL
jgi:hypothetical protein